MKIRGWSICLGVLLGLSGTGLWSRQDSGEGSLCPWTGNPFYWEYRGQPVLLIGGSDDDNLFQWPGDELRPQLDLLQSIGGNYVRNTMSDRRDRGFEVYPYARREGLYDLDSWNPEYWRRFERFLRWTAERGIFVQIEVWDRFDYSRENWGPHPYHPANNVNYGFEESGLAAQYPSHPGRNEQPFFFTTPRQRNNQLLLAYQQRFVEKMLSYSLDYSHILYCMDNETNGEEEWGRYWARYIKERAREAGTVVQTTEMWDAWDLKSDEHRRTFDHPELYDFVDVSQNNHNQGDVHWENALWVRRYISSRPRPINTVKTYGADGNKFGHTDQDGIERFWRHLLAGFASARFHRPDSGLGLGPKARASILAARALEKEISFWDLAPRMNLLSHREPNEAYAAADPGRTYLVYFPAGGEVVLTTGPGPHRIGWLQIESHEWRGDGAVVPGGEVVLEAPDRGHWVALVRGE